MIHKLGDSVSKSRFVRRETEFYISRIIRILLLATLTICSSNELLSQERAEIGDTIEFEYRGSTYKAEVYEYFSNNWYRVKLNLNGREVPHTVDPKKAKLIQRKNPQPSENEEPLRTWNDSSGKFSIQARLRQLGESEVTLEKSDGGSLVVPFDKLSQSDQSYLTEYRTRQALADSTLKDQTTNSEEKDEARATEQPAASSSSAKPGSAPAESGEAMAATVPESAREKNWLFQPTSDFPALRYWREPISITALRSNNTQNNLYRAAVSPDGKLLILNVNRPQSISQVVIVDVTTGRVLLEHDLGESGFNDNIAISNNAKWIVVAQKKDKIDAYRLENGRLSKDTSISQSLTKIATQEFATLMFLDESRLLLAGRDSAAVSNLNDTKGARRAVEGTRISDQEMAFSSDRRFLFLLSSSGVWIIDLTERKAVAAITDSSFASHGKMAVSKDNQHLAVTTTRGFKIYDLRTGTFVNSINVRAMISDMFWVAPNMILINQNQIFETTRGICLWKGESVEQSLITSGDQAWKLENNKLVLVQYPYVAQWKSIQDALTKYDKEDLLLLKPNTKLKLELQVEFNNPGIRREIEEWIVNELKSSVVVVDDTASTKLQVLIRPGAELHGVVIEARGRNVLQELPVRPVIYQIKVIRDSKVVWEDSRETTKMYLARYPNESIHDTIARYTSPNLPMLQGLDFPTKTLVLPDNIAK